MIYTQFLGSNHKIIIQTAADKKRKLHKLCCCIVNKNFISGTCKNYCANSSARAAVELRFCPCLLLVKF